MNTDPILPDDPRITAFALGELEGEARAEVEAAIAADDQLRLAVEQIRATGAQLAGALAAEARADVGNPNRVESSRSLAALPIIPGRDPRLLDGGDYSARKNVLSFPRMYYVIAGLAAACFAVLIVVNQRKFGPSNAKVSSEEREIIANRTIEIPLSQPATDTASATVLVPAAVPEMAPQKADAPPMLVERPNAASGAQVSSVIPASPLAGADNSAPVAPLPASTPPAARDESLAVGSPAAPTAAPAPSPTTIVMTPFEITEDKDQSFQTSSVGTGSRLQLDLNSSAGSYSVINQDAAGVADSTGTLTRKAAIGPAGQSGAQASGGSRAGAAGGRGGGGAGGGGLRGGGGGRGVAAGSAGSPGGLAGIQSTQTQAKSRTSVDSYAVETFDMAHDPNLARDPVERVNRYPAGRPVVVREAPASESYTYIRPNPVTNVDDQRYSTFSIDVDTASYTNVRRFLNNGQLPPRDAIRIEEMVNYFPYRYAPPRGDTPFAISIESTAAPWNPEHRLVRIGIKGREVNTATRPRANLVFLLDVSGSMGEPNKLPLVKDSMRMLLRRLREDDRVAIVTYAGNSGVALRSTPVSRQGDIARAIDALEAGGSTNGGAGINLAYDIAQENFVRGGINRVILCTDGDFNVGVTSQGDLVRMIEDRAKSNVFLTVLGFGMGNLKDSTLELLADKGNGNYGYIDTRAEAEKLLVDQLSGTLITIAKDVKIQVEFNPLQVSAYRLIGYESRMLAAQDFNNDRVDAGEIGAGHTVTALYEVVPADSGAGGTIDPPRYQASGQAVGGIVPQSKEQRSIDAELLTVKLRYKEPTGTASKLLEFPYTDSGRDFSRASEDFKFASAVAAFGLALRGDTPQQSALIGNAIAWADASLGPDEGGYRREFVDLARKARALVR